LVLEIFNTLKAMYSIPFGDIRLHLDMIGSVCIVYCGKEKYVLKLFRSKGEAYLTKRQLIQMLSHDREVNNTDMLIEIYNASFYDDYIKYGACPAYGRTRASMEESIEKYPKMIIFSDDIPIGAISIENKGNGEYYLGCLCVTPQYQGKGIGTQAVKFMLDYYEDWNKVTLVTPADKEENINFYTKKCALRIYGTKMDGNVKLVHLLMER